VETESEQDARKHFRPVRIFKVTELGKKLLEYHDGDFGGGGGHRKSIFDLLPPRLAKMFER